MFRFLIEGLLLCSIEKSPGRADVVEQSAFVLALNQANSCPLSCSNGWLERRVGYIGEGGSGAGATSLSASPMPHSLVTFLAGQESNITATSIFLHNLLNICA